MMKPSTPRAAASLILLRPGRRHGASAAIEVLLVRRSPEVELHARRLGVPGRRRRTRRRGGGGRRRDDRGGAFGPRAPRLRGARAWRGGRDRAAGARRPAPLVAVDHSGGRARSLRHSLLRDPRAASFAGQAGRSRDDRGDLDLAGRGSGTPSGDDLPLVFPTIKHLESLLPYSSSDEVLAAARDRPIEPVVPRVVREGEAGAWSSPASPATTRPALGSDRSDYVSLVTATLPQEVRDAFERFITCEYTTVDARQQPIVWPVTPFYSSGAPTLDTTTGLGYPKKANDARRNPQVAFCSRTRPAPVSRAGSRCSCRGWPRSMTAT